MNPPNSAPVILMAEDDDDYAFLVEGALKEILPAHLFFRVSDGEELLEYLLGAGQYGDKEKFPRPMLILLDLNMPRKNGYEALKEIRSNGALKDIPVIMLTVSHDRNDILRSYVLGANSFIVKPYDQRVLTETFRTVKEYWFEIVQLPPA